MICIYCKNSDTKVIDSRLTSDNLIKRRRECVSCAKRFSTFEKVELPELLVVKKDGSVAVFDRNKINKGIVRALVKRKYDISAVNNLVDNIVEEIKKDDRIQITSEEIGAIILKHLLSFDEVAYVRFASVYNKFDNLDSFIDIINKIKKEKD